jgi:hypothetical protein
MDILKPPRNRSVSSGRDADLGKNSKDKERDRQLKSDEKYKSNLSYPKLFRFEVETFKEYIGSYNSEVSRLIDAGFNLNTLDKIFDIRYLNFSDEFNKLFPNANLQYSGGTGAIGGGPVPQLPSSDEIGNIIDKVLGTSIGEEKKAYANKLVLLRKHNNGRRTELEQIEEFNNFFKNKDFINYGRNVNIQKLAASMIKHLQEEGYLNVPDVIGDYTLDITSPEMIASLTKGVLFETAQAYNLVPGRKYADKIKLDKLIKILTKMGTDEFKMGNGKITYNGTSYVKKTHSKLKLVLKAEIDKVRDLMTSEQGAILANELELHKKGKGLKDLTVDELVDVMKEKGIPISDIKDLVINVFNMLSSSVDFITHMKGLKLRKNFHEDYIKAAIAYIMGTRLGMSSGGIGYIIAKYVTEWIKKKEMNIDINSPKYPTVDTGSEVDKKPIADVAYQIILNEFEDSFGNIDDVTRGILIDVISKANASNNALPRSSTETQKEREDIQLKFINETTEMFKDLINVIVEIKPNIRLYGEIQTESIWGTMINFFADIKNLVIDIKKIATMTQEERIDRIFQIGKEIYNLNKKVIRKPELESKEPEQETIEPSTQEPTAINTRRTDDDMWDETRFYNPNETLQDDSLSDLTADSLSDLTGDDNFDSDFQDEFLTNSNTKFPDTPPMFLYPSDDVDINPLSLSGTVQNSDNETEFIEEVIDKILDEEPEQDKYEDDGYESVDEFEEVIPERRTDNLSGSAIQTVQESELESFRNSGVDTRALNFFGYVSEEKKDEPIERKIENEVNAVLEEVREERRSGMNPRELMRSLKIKINRLVLRLKNAPASTRRVLMSQLNRMRTRNGVGNLIFTWGVYDSETGLQFENMNYAILYLVRRQRIFLSNPANRIPGALRQRLNTAWEESYKRILKARLARVIQIGTVQPQRNEEDVYLSGIVGRGAGGGGDPDDPNFTPGFSIDAIPRQGRFVIPIRKSFFALITIAGAIGSSKVLFDWLKGDTVEVSKDNKVKTTPKKSPTKTDKVDKNKTKTDKEGLLPDKFMRIGHNEWFDSVGLGSIIDTYNGFADAYNTARADKTITTEDLLYMSKKIRDYYDKFAKAVNAPALSELQEAKERYEGLKKQYDDAVNAGGDINSLSVIYTELIKSMNYLDRMTSKFTRFENGIFGTNLNKDSEDVTVDDKDSNTMPKLVNTPEIKKGDKLMPTKPSNFLLSKGMKERIERKLNKVGQGNGILEEQELFDNFSKVETHKYPEGIGLDNPLTVHNKRHEIMQYNIPNSRANIKVNRYSKPTGQKVIFDNVFQFDDVPDDAYYNNPNTKLVNPFETKSDNYTQFNKSKLYNPEYDLQNAFQNKNGKNTINGGNMIRSGIYANVDKDQYYQGGTIQYEQNKKLNDYPMTTEITMGIKRRLPKSFNIK